MRELGDLPSSDDRVDLENPDIQEIDDDSEPRSTTGTMGVAKPRTKKYPPRRKPLERLEPGTPLPPGSKPYTNPHESELVEEEYDSTPVIEDDPLFGPPGKNGLFKQGEDEESYPVEVLDAMDEYGFRDISYVCDLKKIPADGSRAKCGWVANWSSGFPSHQWVAERFGPGEYALVFRWRKKEMIGGTLKTRGKMIEIPMFISEDCSDMHEEFMFNRALNRAKKRRETIQKEQLSKMLELDMSKLGINDEPQENRKQDAISYIQEIAKMGEIMGWKTGGVVSQSKMEWEKVLPLGLSAVGSIVTAIAGIVSASKSENNKLLLAMLGNKQDSSVQALELIKAIGMPDSNKAVEQYHNMVAGMLDLKQMVAGGKESAVDKVIGAVERVLPMVVMMAAVPKTVRESTPMYGAAKAYVSADENFQSVINDKRKLIEFVNKIDQYYGWEQANMVLDVGGIRRPDECNDLDRRMRFPPGDPRNEENELEESDETRDIKGHQEGGES